MNDPQYQTGSSWALGGALRALGGALGSRYRRQKSAKNVPKIPKKRCRRALYAKFPCPSPPPRARHFGRGWVLVRARASERPTPQRREQRAQSKYKSSESESGSGSEWARCAHAPCSRAPACTPHTQRAHARHSRALPVPHQKLGPGGGKGLLVATGHGRRRRRSRSKQRSPLPADL